MAISREEISEIAEAVAEKIIGKALCKCAFTTWHRRLDFDATRKAIEKRDWKWIEDAIPHVDEAIRDMESACKIDLSDAKVSLADVESYTKERNFLEVSLAMYGVTGKISNKLYECSQKENDMISRELAAKERTPGGNLTYPKYPTQTDLRDLQRAIASWEEELVKYPKSIQARDALLKLRKQEAEIKALLTREELLGQKEGNPARVRFDRADIDSAITAANTSSLLT